MIDILRHIQKFLNDNLGAITFLVGFIAIYLYIKQRIDKRRDAARLILQEIRYAEQQIRNSGGYSLTSKLLPTNSWNDNIHLFIKDLKETQIDMISEFYSNATYIDYLITERSRQKIHPKFSIQPNQQSNQQQGSVTSQAGASQEVLAQPTQQQIMQIIQIPTPDENITIQLLTGISSSIEFLYNTPAVEKLRQISERKWYYLI